MSKALALAVLSLTLPAANAVEYSWTYGTKICGGIKELCSGRECTKTAVGPCPVKGEKPKAWLESQFEVLAFVNSEKYLDVKTGKVSSDEFIHVIESKGYPFRDVKDEVESDGGKFAYSMVGSVFGDETAGGYAGLVSYLNTGTTTLKNNTAHVFAANTDSVWKERNNDWSDTEMGAPNGPYLACISEISADKKCGTELSIEPDEYKFSIFGVVEGNEWDQKVQAGVGEFPVGMDKMGVRMQLTATGFNVKDLKVNGKSWAPSMVNEDVKSMSIMGDSDVINYEFPKKYNTGNAKDAEKDKELPNTGTHDMAIRISTIDEDKQTIMIDYLFDTSKLKEDTWFIYDPDVTAVASAANTYTIAAATFSAVATVVGLLM